MNIASISCGFSSSSQDPELMEMESGCSGCRSSEWDPNNRFLTHDAESSSEDEDLFDEEDSEEDSEEEDDQDEDSPLGRRRKRPSKASDLALRELMQSGHYPDFLGVKGPSTLIPSPSNMTPLDYVRFLWPTALCELIASETNRYAIEVKLRTRWVDVTAEEVWAFLGIVLAMGIHRVPRIRNYWSSHPLLGVRSIQNCMPIHRFWEIWSNLHLIDNSTISQVTGQSCKLRPLTDVLSRTFLEHYNPGQQLSIDESMVKYTGRGKGKVKMPKKHTREGFKVWSCSSSETGYLLKFQIYDGRLVDASSGKKVSERGLVKMIIPCTCICGYLNFNKFGLI